MRTSKKKKFSIILPSYNYAWCINEAIDSVLAQNYKNLELIIVDDGSTDNSVEVIEKYLKKYPDKIKLFFHPNKENRGLAETYKLGLTKCNGEFIAFIEADDIWYPDYLSSKIPIFEKHKDVILVYNDVEMFGDEKLVSKKIKELNYIFENKDIPIKKPFNEFKFLLTYNSIFTFSCFVVRSRIFEKIDFTDNYGGWLDWWLLAQLSILGSFYFQPLKLTKWRIHKKSFFNHEIDNKKIDFFSRINNLRSRIYRLPLSNGFKKSLKNFNDWGIYFDAFAEELEKRDNHIPHLEEDIKSKDSQISHLEEDIKSKDNLIKSMENSLTWRVSQKFDRLLSIVLRNDSFRGALYELLKGEFKIKNYIRTSIKKNDKIDLKKLKDEMNGKEILLFIDNPNLSGGSALFSRKWLNDNSGKYFILNLDYSMLSGFELRYKEKFIIKLNVNSKKSFHKLIEEFNVSSIFVNQLAHTDVLKISELISSVNIPYSYMVHDYLCLCPSINLVHNQEIFTNYDCTKNPFCFYNKKFEKWRASFRRLLRKANIIYTPSYAAKEVILDNYPELSNIEVKEHDSIFKFENIFSEANCLKSSLTIGVLGGISNVKGLDILYSLAREINDKKLPIKLKIIGKVSRPPQSSIKNVIENTGRYDPLKVPKIIKDNDISFFLFPSIWPETFSYVCDEIIQLGYPIITFDLGAQKERIKNGKYGWLVSIEKKEKGILDKIIELNNDRNKILEKAKIIKEDSIEEIDIILPVFNGLDYLKNCIDSVLRNTDVKSNLFIIDDCSTDPNVKDYLDNLKSDNSNINLIILYNEGNLGFPKTVNKIMRASNNHCVLLNSDVIVPSGWLSRLYNPLKLDPYIASITPYSNNATIFSFPISNKSNALPKGYSVDEVDKIFHNLDNKKPVEVPTGVGFCMMLNRNVLNDIGYLDENSFGRGYGEENDWCMRAIKKGYKNVHVQNLFVYHKGEVSFNEDSIKLKENNLRKLYKMHPEYVNRVRKYILKDPARKNREIVKRMIKKDNESIKGVQDVK